MLTVGSHVLVHGLVGLPSSTLRVRVERVDERAGCVWVRTADLRDTGTSLVLDVSQVSPEGVTEVVHHRDGLVALA